MEFCARWLPHNWEEDLWSKILSACLYPKKQCFEEWAAAIQSINVSLQGTQFHLDDDRICLQLEARLYEDLCTATRDAKAHEILPLHPWITKIKELNNCRILNHK